MSGLSNKTHRLESEISDSTLAQLISYPESFPDLPQSLKPDTWRISQLRKGCTKFAKKSTSHFKNSRRQKCDKKQVPYQEPTNIRRQFANFGTQDDMAPRIFAPLDYVMTDHST